VILLHPSMVPSLYGRLMAKSFYDGFTFLLGRYPYEDFVYKLCNPPPNFTVRPPFNEDSYTPSFFNSSLLLISSHRYIVSSFLPMQNQSNLYSSWLGFILRHLLTPLFPHALQLFQLVPSSPYKTLRDFPSYFFPFVTGRYRELCFCR